MAPPTDPESSSEEAHRVDFTKIRSFRTCFGSSLKETFCPDDPFKQFQKQPVRSKIVRGIKYLCPIFEWGSNYSFRVFQADLLAGITIASLAIPQGISYAKLANLPPIIGLYSSFVPPLIYAVFGTSRDLAVGTVAASSLLAASIIGEKVSFVDDPQLYLHLFYTATFCTGVFEAAMGFFRLGFLVDFLSRPTIVGFMGGTATIIILQQLKGFFGLVKFTPHTDMISVLHSVFVQTHEWRWQSVLMGMFFLSFLLGSQYLKKRKPKLFWLSAASPMAVVIIGGLLAYIFKLKAHGIHIVGHLQKGLNPLSVQKLNFDRRYFGAVLKAGLITGIISMAEGMAVGRIFGVVKNYQIDGNKEMIAFGLMNIAGSFTSCYLTTGPFSKSAVNNNAGCMTAASNIVMSIIMMMVLLFMAPLFSYTPLVSLSAIITAAMLGLIKYKEIYRFYLIDKVDFLICIAAFAGVVFVSMDTGLLVSVVLSVVRALLYVARPGIAKMGRLSNTGHYRDIEQYPDANTVPGMLVLHMGSPLYFASAGYFRERISRWVEEEQEIISESKGEDLLYVILDMGGVTTIDKTGIDMLVEVRRTLEKKGMKLVLSNPKIDIIEKIVLSSLVDVIGKDYVFVSVEDAVSSCRYMLEVAQPKPSCAV